MRSTSSYLLSVIPCHLFYLCRRLKVNAYSPLAIWIISELCMIQSCRSIFVVILKFITLLPLQFHRSHFPLNLLFACCCRFIIDDAMSPTMKVKGRVLDYLKDLLVMMPVDAINNPTPEVVKSISRIIAWSTEPKSADVRRVSIAGYFIFSSWLLL